MSLYFIVEFKIEEIFTYLLTYLLTYLQRHAPSSTAMFLQNVTSVTYDLCDLSLPLTAGRCLHTFAVQGSVFTLRIVTSVFHSLFQ